MYVDKHIILGLIFSAFTYPVFGTASVIVFMSSVAIDIDHYIYYLFKKGDASLIRAIKYFLSDRSNKIYPLHSVELLMSLLAASFLYSPLLYVFMGFGFHIALDIYDSIAEEEFEIQKFLPLLAMNLSNHRA